MRPKPGGHIFINFPHFEGMLGACHTSRLILLRGPRDLIKYGDEEVPYSTGGVCALD